MHPPAPSAYTSTISIHQHESGSLQLAHLAIFAQPSCHPCLTPHASRPRPHTRAPVCPSFAHRYTASSISSSPAICPINCSLYLRHHHTPRLPSGSARSSQPSTATSGTEQTSIIDWRDSILLSVDATLNACCSSHQLRADSALSAPLPSRTQFCVWLQAPANLQLPWQQPANHHQPPPPITTTNHLGT